MPQEMDHKEEVQIMTRDLEVGGPGGTPPGCSDASDHLGMRTSKYKELDHNEEDDQGQ